MSDIDDKQALIVEHETGGVGVTSSKIVVIGASAGGIAALQGLAAALPATFPAPILVVLHIGAHKSELAAFLNGAGPLLAKAAEDGEALLDGHIYVAPSDRHMIVDNRTLRLVRGPKVNWARPAIDPLFTSAAASYGPNAIGVILTGRLNDGTLGLLEIKRRGGIAIAQDAADAAYPDMPSSAASHVELDYCPPLADLPGLLVELVRNLDGKDAAMPITPSQPNVAAGLDRTDGASFDRPVTITCPDCGGALRQSQVGSIIKYDCHIGHSYTAEVIATAQFEELEKVMRSAVRFLNERAEFCLQMAERGAAGPDDTSGWQAAGKQALDRAYKLRDLVEQDWITPEGANTTKHNGRQAMLPEPAN